MYRINCEPAKNRILITLVGQMDIKEMVQCVDETIRATGKLKKGYDVITDISEFTPATPEVTKEIQRVQAHFVTSGVRRGVRVLGSKVVAGMQFKRTGSGVGYPSVNVATLEEAERELAK